MAATRDSTLADPQQLIADLQRQLAERTAERDEALAREFATSEVLQVIDSSPGDLTPVLAASSRRTRYRLPCAHLRRLCPSIGQGLHDDTRNASRSRSTM